MAGGNMNQCNFIGRLTRDPERRDFQGGSSVVTFGFAFTGQSRKNPQTGQWEDEPCFIDVKTFISKEGKGTGKVVMDYAKKGTQLRVTGRLVLEQWEDKNGGGKRSKHVIYLDEMTLLGQPGDRNGGGNGNGGGGQRASTNGGNYAGNRGGGNGGGQQRGNQQAHQGADGWNADNYEYGGNPPPMEAEDIPF